MSLRLLAAGTYTLVVDAGRPRSRGLGIPVGGPADALSLALGNALVGNAPDTPALEFTLTGPKLVAETDVGMCVFGAPFRLERDGEPLEAGHTFTLHAGQSLQIGGTPIGCRAYLCVVGGFDVPLVLESATSFEPLRAGDLLPCERSRLPGRSLAIAEEAGPDAPSAGGALPWIRASGSGLRVLPGPQADWFGDAVYRNTYRVTPASNRMGVRLDGPPLDVPNRELVSEAVAPGAVQITNDGKPIVLGVDGQTTGGYPKIAHIISVDLDALGQLRPGNEVHFERVSESIAEAAAARRRDTLRKWLRRIGMTSQH
jgi:5-oxoprolinase (ATP-hydrolysing) subunit C